MKRIFSFLCLSITAIVSNGQMRTPISDGCTDPVLTISGSTASLCPGTTYTYTPAIAQPPGFVVESFQWSPLTGIIPVTLASGTTTPPALPIICPDVATTYNLTTWSVGPNLIYNGDFHTICTPYPDPTGVCPIYSGFTTEYQDYQGASGNTQAHIKVGTWDGSGAQCLPPMPLGYDRDLDVITRDGTGADFYTDNRMLNVRGATCIGHRQWMGGAPPFGWWDNDHCAEADPAYFWGQNVHLCKKETYRFTYYVRLMSPCTNPGEQPKITVALANGENMDYTHSQTTFSFTGGELDGGLTGREVGHTGCGGWEKIEFTFTFSGATGNYFICMIDKNTNGSGNDFSIDDISLKRINKSTATITLNPIPHVQNITVTPNDASGGYDGYPCAGSNPFTINCTPGATVVYNIDGGVGTSVTIPSGTYIVPFTAPGGTSHTLTIDKITIGSCTIDVDVTKKVMFIDKPKDILISGPRQLCQGEDFTLTATATYAEPGKYGTTYSWSPSPTSTSANSAMFHASDPGTMLITCTITNNCGTTTSEVFKVWVISAGATASVVGCNPTCPGGTTDIVITGTPDAVLYYTTDVPGYPPSGTFTMPSGTGLTTTVSLPTLTLPDGSYFISINEVDANGCKNTEIKKLNIFVRKPICNLALHIPAGKPADWTPCYGDDFSIDVSGDPGDYTVACGLVNYTVTVTAGATTVSPPFHMPEANHSGIPYGIATVEITKIVGCGGCTVELTEGTYLCDLHVYAAMVPWFNFITKPYCTGTPSPITLQMGVSISVTGSTWYPDDPYPGEWAGETYTSPANMSHSVTATTTGFHTYKAMLTASNGCTYTNSVTLDMKPGPDPIGGASTVCAGSILTLTESATPGTGRWSPSFVTWPWELLKVDQSGVVHAYNPGVGTVYYELPGGCKTAKNITITAGEPIRGTNYICGVPGTTTLTIAFSGGTWSSSAPGIATVDASGVVTSTGYGTAIISYTPSGGSGCIAVIDLNVADASLATVQRFHGASPRPLFMCPHVVDPCFYRITAPMDAKVTFSLTTSTPGCALPSLLPFATYNSATDLYTATIPWMGVFDFEANWDDDFIPSCSITSVTLVQMEIPINGSWCTVPLSGTAVLKPGHHNDDNTSINGVEHTGDGYFSIYPNPNNGSFSIVGQIPETIRDKNLSIEITDVLGHLLYSNKLNAIDNKVNQIINLQNSIPPGNYLLKIKNGEFNNTLRFTIGN